MALHLRPCEGNKSRASRQCTFARLASIPRLSPTPHPHRLPCQVDAARNLIYVVGQVPGHKGNFVRVADAVKKAFEQQPMRPLVPPAVGQGSGVATLDPNGRDPYDFQD